MCSRRSGVRRVLSLARALTRWRACHAFPLPGASLDGKSRAKFDWGHTWACGRGTPLRHAIKAAFGSEDEGDSEVLLSVHVADRAGGKEVELGVARCSLEHLWGGLLAQPLLRLELSHTAAQAPSLRLRATPQPTKCCDKQTAR